MYINLFKTFFKIGIVTFGGGYAMIPMIEEDVVRRNKWVSKDEFIDLLAIAQTCLSSFFSLPCSSISFKTIRLLLRCLPAFALLWWP